MSSLFEQIGLSIHIHNTEAQGARWTSTLQKYDAYSHRIDAMGGYIEATFGFPATEDEIYDWYVNGLGRHIEVWGSSQEVWEGFVNQIELAYADRTITLGPLLDIANRVIVTYTQVYPAAGAITRGGNASTAAADNADSQTRYGIFSKTVSAGDCRIGDAAQVRDVFLSENAWPQKNETLRLSAAGVLHVQVTCAGYMRYLELYHVLDTTSPATSVTVPAKIQIALAAEPNTIFSTDYSAFAVNALGVQRAEDGTKTAADIIKTLCRYGDSGDDRYLFGIYNKRKAAYSAAGSAYFYNYRLSEGIDSLSLVNSTSIKPWEVRPAKWLHYIDFPILQPAANLRKDPQALFIESVQYSAPYSMTLQGGRVRSFEQKLARLGLGSA